MNKGKLLILDCHYLCRRAQFTSGMLGEDGIRTGTIFGFLRDLLNLQERFATTNIVFCFDGRGSERRKHAPNYKCKRYDAKNNFNVVQKEEELQFHIQVTKLKEHILDNIGYRNVFWQDGYEADDLIAYIVGNTMGETIIVSSDKDLYQLLCRDVSLWNPATHKMLTEVGFRKLYQISPPEWVRVKAIAGCSTDNVVGVKGIGETLALRYIRGELDPDSNWHKKIRASKELIHDNKLLVRLPFPGTRICDLEQDVVTEEKWQSELQELGLKSLLGMVPTEKRKRA